MKDNKNEQNKVGTFIPEKLLKTLKFKFSEFISNFITYLLNKIFTFFKNMPSRFSTTSAKVHPEIKSNKQTMNPLHHNATNANELSTHASASTASAANSTAANSTAQDQLEVNELDNNAGYLPISDVLSIITEKKIIIPADINKLLKETSFVKIEMLPNNGFGVTLLDSNLNKVIIDDRTKEILEGVNNQMLTNPDAAKMIENTVATAGNDNLGTVSVPRSIDGGGVKKHYTTYETYKISLDKVCKTGDISIVKNLLDGALGEKNGEEITPGFKSFLETYKVPDGVKNDDIKREIVDIKIKIDAEKFKEKKAVSRNSLP